MQNNQSPQFLFEQTNELTNRKHILIIDDDVEMLKTLRYYLQDAYKVTVVSSGKVLLDYMMPMFNGAAVLKIIKSREATKNIPVFFLTGQTDKNTVIECLSLKPAGYIVKPVAKDALLEKMAKALSKP